MADAAYRDRRSRARDKLVQALYQHAVTGQSAEDIRRQFLAEGLDDADAGYFREVIGEIIARAEELDERLAGFLDRPLVQLDPVERAILRLGAYELADRLEIPYRVVIDEAVELAQRFGAEASYRYINGVLDRYRATVAQRAGEQGGNRSSSS